jgi:hypothetical protein
MEDRLYVELINKPVLQVHRAAPAEYGAGIKYAIGKGRFRNTRTALPSTTRRSAAPRLTASLLRLTT